MLVDYKNISSLSYVLIFIRNSQTMKLQFLHTCIVLALHIETRTAVPLVHCGPGEKLVLAHGQKPDVCVPCPSRQYQNKKHHR